MDKIQQQIQPATEPKVEILTPLVPSQNNTNDPEIEKLRTENTALQDSLRMRDARDDLNRLLHAAGARSPELLFAAAKDNLQFSDNGKVENAAAIVEHLKSTFPDQFGINKPDRSIDGGTGSSSPTRLLTAEILSKMTPAEIQKLNWDDVRQVISDR